MKKLPHNFRPALDKIAKVVTDGKESYRRVIGRFNQMNQILEKYECEPYDMDRVLHEYRRDNELSSLVEKLRSFTYRKNKLVFRKVIGSKEWKSCLKSLKQLANSEFKKYVHTADVEKGLMSVMKRYGKHWLGFWSLVQLDSKGKVERVNLIDHGDRDRFLKSVYDRTKNEFVHCETRNRVIGASSKSSK